MKGTYTPGTYSATSAGFSSDVTVTMTFDAERITDMQVDVSGETPDVGGQIGDKIIERIMDAQSADVDSVTGATRSSEAVKQAAAGKDEDYAKAPNLLFRINEGPFYAEKLSRSSNMVLVTLAGLFVDGHQQCLDQNFEPIPGLFATGNTSGGRFPLQYTAAMNGLSIGFATVFGALLGEYLGQEAPAVSTGDSATSARGTQG